ncbi:MAG: hypothetical protein QOF72_1990, partial [Blastocatellia bacterium]|nr:hypothetical protein [Blastocatellia bacterium]
CVAVAIQVLLKRKLTITSGLRSYKLVSKGFLLGIRLSS